MSLVHTIVALCLLLGAPFEVAESRVTVYAPGLMDSVNCMEPCDLTATMTPATPGIVAACAPDRLGQSVYVEGVGWRECQDTGGAINGTDVDVLIAAEDCYWVGGFCSHPWSADRQVVFVGSGR